MDSTVVWIIVTVIFMMLVIGAIFFIKGRANEPTEDALESFFKQGKANKLTAATWQQIRSDMIQREAKAQQLAERAKARKAKQVAYRETYGR
jgi:hypothetical protein